MMMTYIWELAVGAFMISLIVQFVTIRYSEKFNYFIDCHLEEKPQKFHNTSTSRAGGIGILLGMSVILLTPIGWKLLLSILLAFLSGFFEDLHRSLQPHIRLIMQLFAAGVAISLANAVISYLGLGIYLPYTVAILFSMFSIVGLMNAMNIIDGFNGLASGAALLILLSLGHTTLLVGDEEMFNLILITFGTILAFFIINFPKGKIFLGDGGAYLIGFIIALIGIFLAGAYPKISPWYILTILIYPVWEVLFSIFRKLKAKHNPFHPDSYHLHMLVYKHITHNNPLTSITILSGYAPFILFSSLFPHNSKANMVIALLFIIGYTVIYRYLYRKETEGKI